ncbi:MAG: response regulator, partial [Pseudomonadota bacterium]|nr:response regulator [Pseudomonadota bacterium]
LTASTTGLHVLVVDDNEASAKTLGWMLEMLGHQISIATSGTKALELAKTALPHIVFLDLGLPDMNGYEVCRAMRAEAALNKMFIVAQTGWGQDEHRQRSREAGFDEHLVKPLDLDAIRALLEKVMTTRS